MSFSYVDSFKQYGIAYEITTRYTPNNRMGFVAEIGAENNLYASGIQAILTKAFPSGYPYVNVQFDYWKVNWPDDAISANSHPFINFGNRNRMAFSYGPVGLTEFNFDNVSMLLNSGDYNSISLYAQFGTPGTPWYCWVNDRLYSGVSNSQNTSLCDKLEFYNNNSFLFTYRLKNLVIRCRTSGEGDFADKTQRRFRTDAIAPTSTLIGGFNRYNNAASNHAAVATLGPPFLLCTGQTATDLYRFQAPPTGFNIKGVQINSLVVGNTAPTALSGILSGASSALFFPLLTTDFSQTCTQPYDTHPFAGRDWQAGDLNTTFIAAGFRK